MVMGLISFILSQQTVTIRNEAKKLGRTQASHGCIRLSLPDSKWLYEKLPVGTKVVVKDK